MNSSASIQTSQRPSLTQHLLLWSLGALALVWLSFVVLGYQTGIEEADELTDGHLASVAALLLNVRASQEVDAAQSTPRSELPGLKKHDYQQSLSVVQWDAQGRLLLLNGSAPQPPFSAAEGFADLQLGTPAADAATWRSFSQWDTARSRKVMVLLKLDERDDLARDIAGHMIEPGLWLLPVVALALGLALRRGLQPLYALSHDVAALDASSAQRLAPGHAWREFEPVVASINTLLDRQQAALIRERRLAHEVAHELRTPLSSISLQASALRGGLSADAQTEALTRIGQDALRAGHVLNQLLALAQTSRAQMHETARPVDLVALARTVCADYVQAAWKRNDKIAVTGAKQLIVQGHTLLLEIALRNLLENALKHTPPHTCIELQLGHSINGAAWVQVCDDGARSGGASTAAAADSLHLGHEIVARVAQAHGAQFSPTPTPAPTPFTTCYRIAFASAKAASRGA
ncbi:MAG: two-component sensor histidine kinase [Giesbergeria sp.]|nr:two-component sensor histidine kinase [Giesbergeria sp.]MBP6322127.1 two-component sensor histidine kinase [Giesbergeria sp.]MBP8840581.1 two-component sensor histidine kinase [Giesbergeria sp.]